MSGTTASFQGLTTGLQTDALVKAIIAQEGRSVQAMHDRQDRNKLRTTTLQSFRASMNTLSVGLAAIQDKFNARTVTSSDTTNAYVSATATGSGMGNFELSVASVATKARISSTMAQNLAVADPLAAIFTGPEASFAVKGTDGLVKTFSLANNSLNGLRDAINASGAAVQASVINTGSGTKPYQLVVTAKDTGTGITGGLITLAAINNVGGSATTVDPALAITTGTLTGTFAAPTDLSGGVASIAAKDSVFTLDGITLTRKSNVVTDAVKGITFTLKQGGQATSTVLTVGVDKAAAVTGMQDVITKFNALTKIYKDAATSTRDTNGTILPGVLSNDPTARSLLAQLKSALTGASAGMPAGVISAPASLGVRTMADGTLSLDTQAFQTAYEKDPNAVMRLFTFAGDSNNGVVSVNSGGAKSPTGPVTFTIDSFTTGGVVSGLFSGTDAQGNAFSNVRLSGANGVLNGAVGTALEGLSLNATALGSGTLTLTRGSGQKVQDLVAKFTASGTGDLMKVLANIDTQNRSLDSQISTGQALLDRRQIVLKNQFAKMETVIAQLKASGGNLNATG